MPHALSASPFLRVPLHRILIVAGMAGVVWVGESATKFYIWTWQSECAAVGLCNWDDVVSGQRQYWGYFAIAAAILILGVVLHVIHGQTSATRPPASVPDPSFPPSPRWTRWALCIILLALSYVPLLGAVFIGVFAGEHFLAAEALVGFMVAAWAASRALGPIRGPHIDQAACYLAAGLGAAATAASWGLWMRLGLDPLLAVPAACLMTFVGCVIVSLEIYAALPRRPRAESEA